MEMGNADAPTCIEEIKREVKRSREGTGILSASEAHRNHLHTPSHDHHFPCAVISYRYGMLFSCIVQPSMTEQMKADIQK